MTKEELIIGFFEKGYCCDLDEVKDTCLGLLKENQELKKQLEEWKHHLKCSKEMLDIQGQKGNYDYDEYMLGLYNGMEYIISLFETREPKYINGKEVKFINNQQMQFIKYLQEEINVQIQEESIDCEITNKRYVLEEILTKYKELIGGK